MISKVAIVASLVKRSDFSMDGTEQPVPIRVLSVLIPWAGQSTSVYLGAVAIADKPVFLLLHLVWTP